MLQVGDWTVHENFDRLTRANEDTHITPRAMDVLLHLARNPGKLVTKEDLLDTFWRGAITSDNAVHKTMAELRRVFGDSSRDPQYIQTYPKRGYRLIAEVRQIHDDDLDETHQSKATTIAVLPFLNLTEDTENRYFGDGLAEDIANHLGRAGSLNAVSHTASFRFRNTDATPEEIGKQLGATHLVEGAVRSQDGRIRTTVQLIIAETGNQCWAMRYDRMQGNQLKMQDELASLIVREVQQYFGLRSAADIEPTMDQSYLKEIDWQNISN